LHSAMVDTKLEREWNAHTAPVWGLDINKTGNVGVSAAWDSTIRIWDLNSGSCTKELIGHKGEVYATRFVGDQLGKQTILSAGEDGIVRCWDSAEGKLSYNIDVPLEQKSEGGIRKLKKKSDDGSAPATTIYGLSVSQDAKWCVVGCDDYTIKQMSLAEAEEGNPESYPNLMTSKLRHGGAVYCTTLTEDQKVLSGSGDNKVFLWDLSRDEPELQMVGHEASVHCCAVMANGRSVLSGSFDHTVQRWDTLSGSSVQKLLVSDKDANVNSVVEIPDSGGHFIAAGTSDGLVRVFDLRKSEVPCSIIGEKKSGWQVGQEIVSLTALAVQGKRMLSGFSDGLIQQTQIKTKKGSTCIIS